MENLDRQEGDEPEANGIPAIRPRLGVPHSAEWTPPSTREEADGCILTLSNDIGLILAQLSEDQTSWSSRTGRSPADYAAWRRRALFAKVHKEHQLRECKRHRMQLPGVPAGHLDAPDGDGGAWAMSELLSTCRRVVAAWNRSSAPTHDDELDAALKLLAEFIADRLDGSGPPVQLVGLAASGGPG